MGMTVFLRASTKPSGEPKRKKSDTSKSNFPREPPSSIVLLLDLRETVSFLRTLECKLEGQLKVISMRTKSTENKDCQRFFFFYHPTLNTPGQEGLVLFYCVHFVGGGVASLAWQLSLVVVACAGTGDVDVAAAEVAAALQGGRG